VLYDDKISPDRATADEVIDAIKNPGRNLRNASLNQILDFPIRARHLILDRHNYDVALITRSLAKPDDVPPEVRLQKYVVLGYASVAAARSALVKLRKDAGVISVGLNERMLPSAIPLDPFIPVATTQYNYQWALRPRANQIGGIAGVNGINVFSAWDNARGHAYIAHLDTGVETHLTSPVLGAVNSNSPFLLHPDLSFNFRPQFAFNAVTDQFGNAIPFDDEVAGLIGHGTHTAGVIAASTGNPSPQFGHPTLPAVGGAGVCWYCALMVGKIIGGPVGGDVASFANGLNWAVKSGAQVVNISGGFPLAGYPPGYCNTVSAACDALQLAADREVIIAAAAGNQGSATVLQFPAPMVGPWR
ncbi:MAG: S8 family serine peptidase, partial [Usitatibacteraceae bacterium]